MFLFRRKKEESIYPSFLVRLLSSVIDVGIATVVIIPLFIMIYQVVYSAPPPTQELRQIISQIPSSSTSLEQRNTDLEHNKNYQNFISSGGYGRIFIEQILQVLILVAMFLFFWIKTQSTPGKMLLSMKIVDNQTMSKPTVFQYIKRILGYALSMLPLGLGIFYIAFNKRHRAFHDILSGTVVISTKNNNV